MDHTASFCVNMKQVQADEGYVEEDTKYVRDAHRNPNLSYWARNTPYPSWDNSVRGEQGLVPGVQTYRPPGYQEPARASAINNDDLKSLMMVISRHSD